MTLQAFSSFSINAFYDEFILEYYIFKTQLFYILRQLYTASARTLRKSSWIETYCIIFNRYIMDFFSFVSRTLELI